MFVMPLVTPIGEPKTTQRKSMRRHLFTILVLLSMLMMLVGVAAAPMASGTATLVSVEYVPSKGPVFTFTVSGKFSRSKLKGTLHVEGGANYGLYCTQVDNVTVKCNTSQKVSGVNVALSWGGFKFWTYVPEAPAPKYCYSVWDWWEFTNYEWTDFGPYCQDTPANEADIILYNVPDPGGSFESFAEFYQEDVSDYCPSTVPYHGPAYYYPGCPEDIGD
jgi:hypothetical protein